ncbi:MAG TPA: NADH-quinone oxidoreductase subunit M [Spirochaetia bacterium]|nr:NADH-quinone oxidoreductase subunit M [Spirochaetia bacterium]
MSLIYVILLPLAGGILAALIAPRSRFLAHGVMLLSLAAMGVVVAIDLGTHAEAMAAAGASAGALHYLVEVSATWIPSLGISFHLGADGLSFVLLGLTVVLGLIALVSSWRSSYENEGFYLLNIGLVLAGVAGVFTAADLILFFLFWELMIVPMYFLISAWGGTGRERAAMKFFLFTQASGLLMLLSMIGLYLAHGSATGTYTFDLVSLSGWTAGGAAPALILFLGFVTAFGVKLAVVPAHAWAPDAYAEAPTAGSILLSGLLLKSGAYGLLRFSITLFPEEARRIAPVMLVLGVVTILYGGILAIRQNDVKRIIAYSSIGHMGYLTLGVFSWTTLGYTGAIVMILSHGFTTSALFFVAGAMQDRLSTRDIREMGGLRKAAPRLAGLGTAFLIFALALPGTGNFLAEFLVIAGVFQMNVPIAVLAVAGSILSVVYALRAIHLMFDGARTDTAPVEELRRHESIALAALALLVLWIGLIPGPIIKATAPAAASHLQSVLPAAGQGGGNG